MLKAHANAKRSLPPLATECEASVVETVQDAAGRQLLRPKLIPALST